MSGITITIEQCENCEESIEFSFDDLEKHMSIECFVDENNEPFGEVSYEGEWQCPSCRYWNSSIGVCEVI